MKPGCLGANLLLILKMRQETHFRGPSQPLPPKRIHRSVLNSWDPRFLVLVRVLQALVEARHPGKVLIRAFKVVLQTNDENAEVEFASLRSHSKPKGVVEPIGGYVRETAQHASGLEHAHQCSTTPPAGVQERPELATLLQRAETLDPLPEGQHERLRPGRLEARDGPAAAADEVHLCRPCSIDVLAFVVFPDDRAKGGSGMQFLEELVVAGRGATKGAPEVDLQYSYVLQRGDRSDYISHSLQSPMCRERKRRVAPNLGLEKAGAAGADAEDL